MRALHTIGGPRLHSRPLRCIRVLKPALKRYSSRKVEGQLEDATCLELKSTFQREAAVRAFLLALGLASIFEGLHISLELLALHSVKIIEAFQDGDFAPLYIPDHVVAFLGWAAFYTIDVVAIRTILKKYTLDQAGALMALRSMVTLPKKMFPIELSKWLIFMNKKDPVPAIAVSNAVSAVEKSYAPNSGDPIATAAGAVIQKKNILPKHLGGRAGLTDDRMRKDKKPGQIHEPPEFDEWSRRLKELADRKCYLKNQWYAAALSQNLVAGGRPVGVEILGRSLVLFRGEDGMVSALDDACPHRGAPLSGGWTTEIKGHTCVVCPYHGWAFSGKDGTLLDVPAAEGPGEWPKRQILPTFNVKEKGGFVWLFFGDESLPDDARPPIPWVQELDDKEWKAVYGEIEFDCSHFPVFENAIDMAHIHYLHSDSFGNKDQPKIRNMQVSNDSYSVTATFSLQNKPASFFWEWTRTPEVYVTARAFLPSTSVITFTLGAGLSFTTFVNTVPIHANKTLNRFALVRNLNWDTSGIFNADAWDALARKAMYKILSEDKEMVEKLQYDRLPKEYSVRADLPQIAFRKLRQQYLDLGYGVYPEEAARQYNGPGGSDTV